MPAELTCDAVGPRSIYGGQDAGGAAYVTDGRGIEIDPSTPLMSGAILRVVVRARARSADADA